MRISPADLTSLAEDAVSDIRVIVHDYATTRSIAKASRNERLVPNLRFGDRTTQFAIANIVAIVELYVELTLLRAGCRAGQVRNWSDKTAEWKRKFGASIDDVTISPAFATMRGFYEARNAIMHNQGELTQSQRKPQVYQRLATANIERIGFILVVGSETVKRCSIACLSCIVELDATLPTPNARTSRETPSPVASARSNH